MVLPEDVRVEVDREESIERAMAKDYALRETLPERYAGSGDNVGVLRLYQVSEPSVVLAYRTPYDDLNDYSVPHSRAKRDGDNILCQEDDVLYSITATVDPGDSVSTGFEEIGPILVDALTVVTEWTADDFGIDTISYGPRLISHEDWRTPEGTPDGPIMAGNSPWWGRNTVQVQGIVPFRIPGPSELRSYFTIPEREEEPLRKLPDVADHTGRDADDFFTEIAGELVDGFGASDEP
ncbi:MAG: hypothetical protein ABEI97_02805, partial [Candidatus Nanohaloarchaea archaeon]